MSKFDQQMREVERSLAKLTGNKAQAAGFRKGLEKKIQQAAVKALPKIVSPASMATPLRSYHSTGFHQFVLDPHDPFPAGYRVGSQA